MKKIGSVTGRDVRHLPPVCAPSLPGMAYIPGWGRAGLSGWLSGPPVGVVCAGGCGVLRNAVFYLYLWRNKKAVIVWKQVCSRVAGTRVRRFPKRNITRPASY